MSRNWRMPCLVASWCTALIRNSRAARAISGREGDRCACGSGRQLVRTLRTVAAKASRRRNSGAGFDDLEPVPVRVLELEHGRDTRPPEQVPDLDAPLPHEGVLGFGFGNQEPDAGVGPGLWPGDQRDRRGCAGGRDRDPAEALSHPRVEPLLEAERAGEELHRLVLVADRESHSADVGDGGLGHNDLLASMEAVTAAAGT